MQLIVLVCTDASCWDMCNTASCHMLHSRIHLVRCCDAYTKHCVEQMESYMTVKLLRRTTGMLPLLDNCNYIQQAILLAWPW